MTAQQIFPEDWEAEWKVESLDPIEVETNPSFGTQLLSHERLSSASDASNVDGIHGRYENSYIPGV